VIPIMSPPEPECPCTFPVRVGGGHSAWLTEAGRQLAPSEVRCMVAVVVDRLKPSVPPSHGRHDAPCGACFRSDRSDMLALPMCGTAILRRPNTELRMPVQRVAGASVTRLVLLRRPPHPRRLTSVRVHTEASDPGPLLEFDIVAVVAAVSTNAHAMPSPTMVARNRRDVPVELGWDSNMRRFCSGPFVPSPESRIPI